VPITAAMDYLKAIGFVQAVQDSMEVLRVEEPNVAVMKASLQEVSNALDMVAPAPASTDTKHPNTVNRQRSSVVEQEEQTSHECYAPMVEKMTEKRKARMLLEEKQQKEKEDARKHRAKNITLIKQDSHVRKHDENWKSGVSAAMQKSGNDIVTFRDRHGEGD
jgi:type III secretory pathway component EscR